MAEISGQKSQLGNIPPYLNLGYKYWEAHYSDLVETYIRDRNIPDDLAVVIRKENLPARIAKGEIMTSVPVSYTHLTLPTKA